MVEQNNTNPILLSLEQIFSKYDLDCLWIKNLPSIKYLTGFTGSTANLLVSTDGTKTLLVDSRYTTQAKQECDVKDVIEIKRPLEDLAAKVNEFGARALGFEANQATFQDHRTLKNELGNTVELIAVDENLANLRLVKTAEELDKLRQANRVANQAFQTLLAAIKPGMTELEAAWLLDKNFRELGASGNSFDTLVASGPRAALVHGKPSTRAFEAGDTIIIDRGLVFNHYCSDETNSYILGKADAKQREIYQIVKDAHDRCLEAVRPGAKCSDLDALARDYIDKKGYNEYFGHGTGHGVGIEVHEMPVISPRGEGYVEEGMVFSIEPGIYIPEWGGIRIEDVVAVTADGCEILTLADKNTFEIPID